MLKNLTFIKNYPLESQDIKSILNKSLSTIDEENQLPFSKTVSFAPSLVQQESIASTASLKESHSEPEIRFSLNLEESNESETDESKESKHKKST